MISPVTTGIDLLLEEGFSGVGLLGIHVNLPASPSWDVASQSHRLE
jgi:hypothetical protein